MKKSLCLLAALSLAPLLAGCFPLIATGVGTGVAMADDPRTTGAQLDDTAIEMRISNLINKRFTGPEHIVVTSYNRVVLLTGEAPNADEIAEAQQIAGSVQGVRRVQNELRLGPPASLPTRAHDSLITTRVHAALLENKLLDTNAFKVVTENGVVFLFGLVTQQQAAAAVNIVRNLSGVARVVELFEYAKPAP